MFRLNVMKTKTPDMHAITAIMELIIGIRIKDIGARLKKEKLICKVPFAISNSQTILLRRVETALTI